MTAETLPGPESLHGTSYKFIFCEHLPENVPQIVEQLQDCDAIAIEMEDAPDQATRDGIDAFLTLATSSDLDDTTRAALEQLLEQEGDSDETSPFFRAMIEGLADSDKPIITIGRNLDEADELHEEARANESLQAALRYTHAPRERIRQVTAATLTSLGQEMPGREKAMAHILRDAPAKLQLATGKTMGVVLGAMHTGVPQELGDDVKSSRVFINADNQGFKLAPGEVHHFSDTDAAMRAARFNGTAHIPEAVLDRIMLTEVYAATPTFMPEGDAATTADKARAMRRAETYIKENLNPEGVTAALSEIDVMRGALTEMPAYLADQRVAEAVDGRLRTAAPHQKD